MIYAATGHRPKDIHGPFTDSAIHDLLVMHATEEIQKRVITAMISGMAEGWDQAVAEACLNLGIPYLAALPFVGQERLWSGRSQERYRRLCAQAHRVEVISPHTLTIAYQLRNEWMVDQAAYAKGEIFALHSGKPGGTGNTVQYAHDWCVPVDNVWESWNAKWTHD